MYEVFECLRCGHIFDMTAEARKKYTKNGGGMIKCLECGCVGVECVDMMEQRSGCFSTENMVFTSCHDCPFEYQKYDCNEYRRISGDYQILTVSFKESLWS